MGWKCNLERIISAFLISFNIVIICMIAIVIVLLNILLMGEFDPSWEENKYNLHVDVIEKLKQIVYTLNDLAPGLFNILRGFMFQTGCLCLMGFHGARTKHKWNLFACGSFTVVTAVSTGLIYLKVDIFPAYEEYIKTNMWEPFERYDPTLSIYDPNGRNRNDIDSIQQMLQCCGVVSYQDWRNATHLSLTASVPDSCCVKFESGCGYNYFDNPQEGLIYTEGCYLNGRNYILNFVVWPWPFFIASGVIQMLCAVCVFETTKQNECMTTKKIG